MLSYAWPFTSIISPAVCALVSATGVNFNNVQFLQRRLFIWIDVAARAFGEAIHKNPAAASIGHDQSAVAAALAMSWARDSLLQQVTAEIGFKKPIGHLFHGATQRLIR
jgi:hypothetical protein